MDVHLDPGQHRERLVFRENDRNLMPALAQMQRNIFGVGAAARSFQREMIDQQYFHRLNHLSVNSVHASFVF